MDFVSNIKRYLSDEFVNSLLEAMSKDRTNSLILNTKKISSIEFQKRFPNVIPHPFLKNVFYYDKNEYEFGKSYLFTSGAYYIMDASSLLVSKFLPIENGDYVLDMCAAPGGKTISLVLSNPDKEFEVISNDISYIRSLETSKNIEHLGISNVTVTYCAKSNYYSHYKEKFNKIILDAPCSGSAMFRKNELAKSDWSIEKVESCARIQNELLEEAIFMLQKGGIISYSTCSFSFEENEEIILNALKNHPEMKLVRIEENDAFYRTKELPEAIHLFPNLYKGEGQFICLLKKDGNPTKIKEIKNDIKEKNILKKFNLNFKHDFVFNNLLYFYNNDLDLKPFSVLRRGLECGEFKKNNFIPSFHLSHYLSANNSIVLDENEAKQYLHGEEIKKNLNIEKGYYVVSFDNINLGFVKYSNGSLKNLFPKGLRH